MKKIGLLLFTCLVFVSLACLPDIYTDYYDETAEEDQVHRFEAALYTEVQIETGNGEITSSVREADSIEVRLRLWATGTSESDAEEHLANIAVVINQDTVSGKLSVSVVLPKDTKRGYGGDVTLYVPDSLFVDLETSNGKIEAEGHRNGIDAYTSNGAIELSNTAGEADLETLNGEIDVDLHDGKITGETSNGAVDAKVIMPVDDGECRLESANGKVRVAVPDSAGASVTLRTSIGRVEVLGLNINYSVNEDNHIEGEIGSGTGVIYLKTPNGDVILEKLQ